MGTAEQTVEVVDLTETTIRQLNQRLHDAADGGPQSWRITHPNGLHAIGAGINAPLEIDIDGHVGYYCVGMNKEANVRIHGSAGVGLAENIMSGTVIVDGDTSQSAAATGRGGLLVVRGNAAARCGISMKGVNIVVEGNVGHLSAFMAQKGALVVCGDAGEALGDSIYETHIYVRGSAAELGADCIEKDFKEFHTAELTGLLAEAGVDADPADFKRYGSARKLYNFNIDNADAY